MDNKKMKQEIWVSNYWQSNSNDEIIELFTFLALIVLSFFHITIGEIPTMPTVLTDILIGIRLLLQLLELSRRLHFPNRIRSELPLPPHHSQLDKWWQIKDATDWSHDDAIHCLVEIQSNVTDHEQKEYDVSPVHKWIDQSKRRGIPLCREQLICPGRYGQEQTQNIA